MIVFVIYGKSLNYEFTELDDDGLTAKKSLYISDIKNFPKFFLTDCYHNRKITQYYRPVLSLSFAIETIMFGINTKIYHLTNIILFVLSLYLMYLFLCKFNSNEIVLKFLILLFCVHPMLVSSVVWLPARNDTLLAVFLFLFLITYVNYVKENKIKYFVLSIIFFVLALFTKETALITFPIMFLLVYCFNLKITKKQILNYLLVVIPILILYFYLRQIAVSPVNLNHYINHAHEYFFSIVYGLMLYIKYIFIVGDIPVTLHQLQFDILSFIINAIVLLSLICLCFFKFINKRTVIFSFVFFILFMLPAFAQENYIWFSHRLVIPLVSIIFVLAEIIDKVFLKYDLSKKYFIGVFVVLFVLFAFSSYSQAYKYKNHEIFRLNICNDAPTHLDTLENLSDVCIENNEYDKAKGLMLQILKSSNDIKYYIKLTRIEYLITKDLDVAESNFMQCLNATNSYYHKATILALLSEIYFFKNNLDKAIEYVKKSLELQPYDKQSLIHLAGYYALNKEFSKARPIYERLLKDEPKNEYYQYLIKTLDEDEKSQNKSRL